MHQLTKSDVNWTWRVKYDVKLTLIWCKLRLQLTSINVNWRQIKFTLSSIIVNFNFRQNLFQSYETSKNVKKTSKASKNIMSDALSKLTLININWRPEKYQRYKEYATCTLLYQDYVHVEMEVDNQPNIWICSQRAIKSMNQYYYSKNYYSNII